MFVYFIAAFFVNLHPLSSFVFVHSLYLLAGKGGWCVELTNLPPSCAEDLQILEAASLYNPHGLPKPV
jgi:hypothetical protein